VALEPAAAGAHNALGVLACAASRYDVAEAHWIEAIEAAPGETAALCNLAQMLAQTGRGDEAAALMGPAAAALVQDITVQWTAAVASNYAPELSAREVAARHRQYGRAVRARMSAHGITAGGSAAWTPSDPDPHRPLRVGWLSPDMREHSVASFLLPLVESLDRSRYCPFAYSLASRGDAITERFRAAVPDFVDVAHLADLDLVRRVRADRIDVLVDCAGLFAGGRPAALTLRMAPVQATWLGYPNTTGLPGVDYRLVDARTDPPGAEALATERLVRIDGCFVCYRTRHPIALPRRAARGPITFGSCNALSKTHPALLDLWAQLLSRVPASRLLLKAGPLADAGICDALASHFASRGIGRERLDLRGPRQDHMDHLSSYAELDVALDTFPYNGTTTTCEALWMGVPVVTLAGVGHPARVGVSLLAAAGLDGWIAETPESYIEIAAELATDPTALAAHHGSLRERVAGSMLCDAVDHARRFEAAIRAMWRERCEIRSLDSGAD
jgi:protein O-GlcNAc transferase